jgi:hypothetical protein
LVKPPAAKRPTKATPFDTIGVHTAVARNGVRYEVWEVLATPVEVKDALERNRKYYPNHQFIALGPTDRAKTVAPHVAGCIYTQTPEGMGIFANDIAYSLDTPEVPNARPSTS